MKDDGFIYYARCIKALWHVLRTSLADTSISNHVDICKWLVLCDVINLSAHFCEFLTFLHVSDLETKGK